MHRKIQKYKLLVTLKFCKSFYRASNVFLDKGCPNSNLGHCHSRLSSQEERQHESFQKVPQNDIGLRSSDKTLYRLQEQRRKSSDVGTERPSVCTEKVGGNGWVNKTTYSNRRLLFVWICNSSGRQMMSPCQ